MHTLARLRATITFRRTFCLLMTASFLFTPGAASAAASPQGLTQQQIYSLGIHFYDVESDCITTTTGAVVASADGTLNMDASQIADAQVIIGVAKTEGLGQKGALIGLMVALTESRLYNLANTTIPLSMSNPSASGMPGSDHDSLGVFQQRISTDWSTISNSPSNKDAVYQLMNPAYAAEAFFGSPPSSNASAVLSKGLQNKTGWQSMDPWVAAQAVQASGTPDGSNYKANMAVAQEILNKYYDSSSPVPLPAPFSSNGNALPASTQDCGTAMTDCSGITAPGATILCAAQKYKGIYYEYGGGHQGYDAYKTGCPDPQHPPDNQPTGGPSLDGGESGNPSPCGLDCSSLVSMAVDDAFDQKFSWSVATMQADTKNWQKLGSVSDAQPGDIVTVGSEHVEIFVSSTGGGVNTFGAHYTGTRTGASSADANYYDAAYRYIGSKPSGS